MAGYRDIKPKIMGVLMPRFPGLSYLPRVSTKSFHLQF